jgi:hypothetical protein
MEINPLIQRTKNIEGATAISCIKVVTTRRQVRFSSIYYSVLNSLAVFYSACARFPSSPAGMIGISFAAGVAASLAVTRRQELTTRLMASLKNALRLLPAVLYPTFTTKLKNFTFKPYYSLVPVALKKSLEESWIARLLLMAAVVEIVTSFPR